MLRERYHWLGHRAAWLRVLRCLAMLLFLFSALAQGASELRQQAQLVLTAQQQHYDISTALLYLDDPDRQLTLAMAQQALNDGQFQGGQTKALNFGFTHDAYWFYLSVANRDSPQQQWILESEYPILDQLDVYFVFEDGRHQHQQAGDFVQFEQRSKAHHTINFALDLASGEQVDIFIRAQTTGSIQMPMALWSEDAFADKVSTTQIAFGLYFGMLFSLGIYNLLLYLAIRDINYVLYVLYIFSYGLFQFSLNGLSFQYLWPNSPLWNNLSIAFLIGTGLFFITTFSRSFLELKKNSPVLNRIMQGFMLFYLGVSAATLVVPYQYAIRIATLGALFGALFIMVCAGVSWYKKFRPARYFFLSWVALLTGMVVYTLKTYSLLPINFITEYAIQAGSVLEVLLLSLALADRIRNLQEANQQIQQQANETLELRVQHRTLELELVNRKLEELSITDGLTGLKNRRYFNEAFELECKRASRNHDCLSLILIDIDHFKNVNDSYGHLAGDECIRQVAAAINEATSRKTDTKCRYGGEEFTLLMPSTNSEGAQCVAQKVLELVRNIVVPLEAGQVAITVSLGLATIQDRAEDQVRQVLAQADSALYRAKAEGRNRLVVYGPPADIAETRNPSLLNINSISDDAAAFPLPGTRAFGSD